MPNNSAQVYYKVQIVVEQVIKLAQKYEKFCNGFIEWISFLF